LTLVQLLQGQAGFSQQPLREVNLHNYGGKRTPTHGATSLSHGETSLSHGETILTIHGEMNLLNSLGERMRTITGGMKHHTTGGTIQSRFRAAMNHRTDLGTQVPISLHRSVVQVKAIVFMGGLATGQTAAQGRRAMAHTATALAEAAIAGVMVMAMSVVFSVTLLAGRPLDHAHGLRMMKVKWISVNQSSYRRWDHRASPPPRIILTAFWITSLLVDTNREL
jgi:hypothetical protein